MIDECYIILDSREDFQSKMAELYVLIIISYSIVLLIAMLPAIDEV